MDTYKPTYVNRNNGEWDNTGTHEIMTFYPTMEEIANFSELVKKIEMQGAHIKSGICKIVPPKGWNPRPKKPADYSDVDYHVIEQPVRERIHGSIGNYVKDNIVYRRWMTVKDFRRMAVSKTYRNPKPDFDLPALERYYWRNITRHEPVYAADTPGSFYDLDVKELNANSLGTILDLTKKNCPPIKGVTTVFLYFGMWKATFPWHAEDMDLYSINYLHYGDPKFWYAIPPNSAEKFERLSSQRFPEDSRVCKAFLRHKVFILSPSLLKTYGIPYGTMVQYPGEIIITFPRGYHMGFNTGYNCAESTNFALERWIDYGKNAVLCYCREDGVQIDMRDYMRIYRKDECKEWEEYWYNSSPTTISTTKSDGIGIVHEEHRERKKGSKPTAAFTATRQKKIDKAKKAMQKLWTRTPFDLFAEKQYNEECGRIYPHCAVCQYFWPRDVLLASAKEDTVPLKSKRFVTDQMFYKDTGLCTESFYIDEDELLVCDNCKVVVHRHCYPTSMKDPFEKGSGHLPHANKSCNSHPNGCTNNLNDRIKQEPEDSKNVATTSDYLYLPGTSKATTTLFLPTHHSPKQESPPASKWLCVRCDRISDIIIRSAYCVSCELRGGALLEINDRNYIHVICAIMSKNVKFRLPELQTGPYFVSSYSSYHMPIDTSPKQESNVDSLSFSPISASEKPILSNSQRFSIPKSKLTASPTSSLNDSMDSTSTTSQQLELSDHPISVQPPCYECEICGHQSDDLIRCDICVETEELGASLHFHVTCAPLADLNFERRFYPTRTTCVCAFHNTTAALSDLRRIDVKQKVYVYSKEDSLVGRGRVRYIYENMWATVDFLDGTVSKEIYNNEIKNCECKKFNCNGSHIPGSLVYVSWHDGVIYQAYYRNKVPVKKYNVELEKTSKKAEKHFVDVLPDNIYRPDEPLPGEIRKALLKRYSDWEVGADDDDD